MTKYFIQIIVFVTFMSGKFEIDINVGFQEFDPKQAALWDWNYNHFMTLTVVKLQSVSNPGRFRHTVPR